MIVILVIFAVGFLSMFPDSFASRNPVNYIITHDLYIENIPGIIVNNNYDATRGIVTTPKGSNIQLTYNLLYAPSFASIDVNDNGQATIIVQPRDAEIRSYFFTVSAEKGIVHNHKRVMVTVVPTGENIPPDIKHRIQKFVIQVADTARVYLNTKIVDDGGEDLTYRSTVINGTVESAQIRGNIMDMTGLSIGRTEIRVCADDGTNEEVCLTFPVEVPDDRPKIVQVPPINIMLNTETILNMSNYFTDDDELVYTMNSNNSTIAVVDVQGNMATIKAWSIGNTNMTACADDAANNPVCQKFTVRVYNDSPEIILKIDDFDILANTDMVIDLSPHFFDLDKLTYTITSYDNKSATASTQGSIATIRGISVNEVDVKACADDGVNDKVCQIFVVTVDNVPPEIIDEIGAMEILMNDYHEIELSSYFFDVDELTYPTTSYGNGTATASTQGSIATIRGISVNEVDVKACADDGVNDKVCQIFVVDVFNKFPEITQIPPQEIMINGTIQLLLHEYFKDFDKLNYSTTALNPDIASIETQSSTATIRGLSINNAMMEACADDGTNKIACQIFDVKVTPDTEKPVIIAPSDVPEFATAKLTQVGNLGTPIVSDNADPNPDVTNNAPDAYPLGNTVVTWTATDISGNSASDTQIVTIKDETPPVFQPIVDYYSETYTLEKYVDIAPLSATDIFVVDIKCDHETNIYPLGNTTVTCTAEDTSGNESTVSFNVEIAQISTEIQVDPENIDNTSGFGKYVGRTADSMIVSGRYQTAAGQIPSIFTFDIVAESNEPERWISDERITDPGNLRNNKFANAISFDGQTIMATSNDLATSAPPGTQNNGAVYVFEKNAEDEWTETQKISLGHLIRSTGNFRSIAMDGNSMAISSYSSTPDFPSGIVDIYERQSANHPWTYAERINPYISGSYGSFGSSIDMDVNSMVIGSAYANAVVSQSGATYILEKNSAGNWIRTATLQPADLRSASTFGGDVAISGDTVIVGAKYLRDRATGSLGAAYVFEKDDSGTWQQTQKLTPDTSTHRYFGTDVNVYGDTITVNAHHISDGSAKSVIYLYEKNGSTWDNTAIINSGFYIFSSPDSLELDSYSMLVANINGVVDSEKTGLLKMYLGDLSSFNSPQTGRSTSGQYDPVDTTRVIADIDGVTFDPYTMEMYVENNDLEYFIYGVQNADDSAKATVDLLSEIIPESAENDITITIVDSDGTKSSYDVSTRADTSR